MNVKAIAFGAVLGFLVAVAPSCGPAKCSSANCKTCCDSKGACLAAPNNALNTTCGTAGNTCSDCTATSSTCNSTSFTCGAAVVDAGPGTCDGCKVSSGTCVTLANTSVINCGINGANCIGCATGSTCTNGACVVVDAGTPTGRIGDSCVSDLDCNKVTGGKAYCKKKQIGGDVTYQGGYCTKYCTKQTDCGTGAHCSYWLGMTGEIEPLCYKDCTSTACRTGYTCADIGFTSSPYNSCLPVQADGGLGEYDAGPGNPGAAGAPCTTDGQCGPAGAFMCVQETQADGGTTPYPGGMCTGDCTMTVSDDWCGDGGICLPYLSSQLVTKYGSIVLWQCLAGCDPTVATNNCRSGYICDPLDPTDPTYKYGTCTPDCRTTPKICGGNAPTCDATNGRCK